MFSSIEKNPHLDDGPLNPLKDFFLDQPTFTRWEDGRSVLSESAMPFLL